MSVKIFETFDHDLLDVPDFQWDNTASECPSSYLTSEFHKSNHPYDAYKRYHGGGFIYPYKFGDDIDHLCEVDR